MSLIPAATPLFAICGGGVITWLIATAVGSRLAASGFPLPDSRQRVGCIDGLRGYLAISVLFYHSILWLEVTRLGGEWARPKLSLFDSLGPGAVNLFFMATGFVFYPHILRGIRANNWAKIYAGRIFRIIPLVVASVVLISMVILLRLRFNVTSPFSYTLLNALRWIIAWDEPALFGYEASASLNAGVLWSLWYEWMFYLFVLPLTALAMTFREGRAPTWTVPAALIIVSLALRPLHLNTLISYLPMFGVGMLAFELQARPAITNRMSHPVVDALVLICLLAGCIIFSGSMRLVCHVVFFISVACGTSLWGLLRTSGARTLGELSYGIYLLHGIVLSVLFVDFSGGLAIISTSWLPLFIPFAAAAVIVFSALTFRAIERPFIKLGKSLLTNHAKAISFVPSSEAMALGSTLRTS